MIAEHAGDASPDRTQRLLNHAMWVQDAAMATVRGFVVERLADELAVAVFDESGQEKQARNDEFLITCPFSGNRSHRPMPTSA